MAGMPRSPARAATDTQCATLRTWTCWKPGTPASTKPHYLAMLPKYQKAVLSKRIAKATARSSSELVFPKLVETDGRAATHPRHPSDHISYRRTRVMPAIWTWSGTCSRSTGRRWPRIGAFCSIAIDLVDVAIKVVGIGSVGTLCMVALMMSIADHPFFLQVKEANASVLEAYAGKSAYAHHGERVVQGQRLMQPASDLFLGWATGPEGRHFYLRQLRDVKLSPLVETYDAEMLSIYAKACGWVLARAHAKAGRSVDDQRLSRQAG